MCDPRNLRPGPDCAHDRADDTWLTPTDLRPTFREPTPPESLPRSLPVTLRGLADALDRADVLNPTEGES